ncbi:MAG: YfhO family protein, partial [Oscillospiraceae bacterium]|nr:YfhO family protein [Oscillospiraceae bacterium]
MILKNSIIKSNEHRHVLWAFLIPFGIMLGIYAALGTYPFGTSSVLVLDLNGQYVYFFEALRDAIYGEGSLIYSFSRAMGGEFLGMYAYYLASPLSYIVALFPKHMMLEALYLMLILKCGLSGATFCYYLSANKMTKNKAAQVMFSCMYALSAYGVVMQHNTMWFDNVILLPLVALGIEKVIKERKYKLFVISLALSVISNFYIGYMVCIFTFVYFFFYYFSRSTKDINPLGEKYHFVRSISRVGIFSAIAIAISAFILLPAVYSLTLGKNDFSDPNFIPTQKFDFLDLLSMMYPGSYDTVRPEGLPLIYCGLPAIIFLPLFFISKKFKSREKIASAIFAVFFVLSFNLSTLDIFWHGMQKPNWLNYRYSFMLCFFVLILGVKVFDKIRSINKNVVLGICGCAAVLLFILQKLEYENIPDFACVWFSIIFLIIYAIGIPLTAKSKFKVTATMILCVFVCLELFIAGLLNLVALDDDVVISSYDSYHNFIDKIQPIIDEVKESDDSFYRMEKNDHRKVNDPMALGLR